MKESQGKVPCVVRFLRTGEEDVGDAAAAATARVAARPKKSCGLLSVCGPLDVCVLAGRQREAIVIEVRRRDGGVT